MNITLLWKSAFKVLIFLGGRTGSVGLNYYRTPTTSNSFTQRSLRMILLFIYIFIGNLKLHTFLVSTCEISHENLQDFFFISNCNILVRQNKIFLFH